MKPDGVVEGKSIKQQLIEEFDSAIQLIYSMPIFCQGKIVVPWGIIHRWQNLIEYAKKEDVSGE